MLDAFKDFIKAKDATKEKYIPYYCRWVANCCAHCKKELAVSLDTGQKHDFLQHMAKTHEEWQVKQAEMALRLYSFYLASLPAPSSAAGVGEHDKEWGALEPKMRERLRLKQRSYSTERTYVGWLRAFRGRFRAKAPAELMPADIQTFLSHLAVEKRISASTQNQALNALIFLFRHVLDREIGKELDAVRADKKKRLPVVMNPSEVQAVFARLSGTNLLMAKLIYGCGLRLNECLALRIKDIDMEQCILMVRSGKGDKDRRTVLPESLIVCRPISRLSARCMMKIGKTALPAYSCRGRWSGNIRRRGASGGGFGCFRARIFPLIRAVAWCGGIMSIRGRYRIRCGYY